MPENIQENIIEVAEFEDDFSPDDFAFTIGPDGELKSIIIPQHLMKDPPEEVLSILRIYGIETLEEITDRTLH
jgi:hypothetical protein